MSCNATVNSLMMLYKGVYKYNILRLESRTHDYLKHIIRRIYLYPDIKIYNKLMYTLLIHKYRYINSII